MTVDDENAYPHDNNAIAMNESHCFFNASNEWMFMI